MTTTFYTRHYSILREAARGIELPPGQGQILEQCPACGNTSPLSSGYYPPGEPDLFLGSCSIPRCSIRWVRDTTAERTMIYVPQFNTTVEEAPGDKFFQEPPDSRAFGVVEAADPVAWVNRQGIGRSPRVKQPSGDRTWHVVVYKGGEKILDVTQTASLDQVMKGVRRSLRKRGLSITNARRYNGEGLVSLEFVE